MESGASQCAKNEDGHIFNHGKLVECDVKVMLPYYRSYELTKRRIFLTRVYLLSLRILHDRRRWPQWSDQRVQIA